MGTRNLTCAVVGGEFKLAQYGQSNGYPGGEGATVYQFVKSLAENEGKEEDFRNKLRQSRFLSSGEVAKLLEPITGGSKLYGLDVSNELKATYPTLHIDIGADVLEMISESDKLLPLKNSYNFGFDSLFCEWAYVIDMDNRVLEVYEGFNKKIHNGDDTRWPNSKSVPGWPVSEEIENEKYGPIVKIIQWKFDELPATLGEFVDSCGEAEAANDCR